MGKTNVLVCFHHIKLLSENDENLSLGQTLKIEVSSLSFLHRCNFLFYTNGLAYGDNLSNILGILWEVFGSNIHYLHLCSNAFQYVLHPHPAKEWHHKYVETQKHFHSHCSAWPHLLNIPFADDSCPNLFFLDYLLQMMTVHILMNFQPFEVCDKKSKEQFSTDNSTVKLLLLKCLELNCQWMIAQMVERLCVQ